MFEPLLLVLVKAFTFSMRQLPTSWSNALLRGALTVVAVAVPKYRRVAEINLKLAFPDQDAKWRKKVFSESLAAFARLLVDACRFPYLDQAWVKKHCQFPFLEKGYPELKRNPSKSGIILVTGHLGSFDLMGHCMPLLGYPIAFVVRNFKQQSLDAWWTRQRESHGNRVISRKGALKGALRELRAGRDVAILFDQNVRAEHGVFVNWFNLPAATTALPAMLALRTGAPVVVASMRYLGDDKYVCEAEHCELGDIIDSPQHDNNHKIELITARLSARYEAMIRANPGEWFWMHRRWRTRPEGDDQKIY